ncbi:DUF6286 domain-containing protein [Streptomyces sp. HUAS TT20]|uniref:DUF6286 domain-containing protein n=1 Tax=Streptomyces sp. HUAS TT20 TaxID=3447509 RepID=UPI0021D805FB|nr:DUF6286 domain-containing protein [Streptomyces sp. HUAS 15-9]UXY32163.1 DUF6286 domain-containing protein [Streptomyces sp. HUAS 15-9]
MKNEPETEAATHRVATSDTEQPRPNLADGPGPGPTAPAGQRVRRFWSSRRVPAAIVSLLAAAVTGLLLYDVTAVRAGRSAMSWRRTLTDELATRPLDDGWMIGGAALAMALGLWLLILAVTPGLRWLLPMRPPADARAADMRAGLSRSAAPLVLRDRAMEVPGVQSARIDVGRRKIRARIRSHFRDLEEVRADLESTLANGVPQLGLARPPALSLDVRRPKRR